MSKQRLEAFSDSGTRPEHNESSLLLASAVSQLMAITQRELGNGSCSGVREPQKLNGQGLYLARA